MTFGNLLAEMARDGIKLRHLAEHLNMTNENIRLKLNGRVKLSLTEAESIRAKFFPTKSIDYLFADTDAILDREETPEKAS